MELQIRATGESPTAAPRISARPALALRAGWCCIRAGGIPGGFDAAQALGREWAVWRVPGVLDAVGEPAGVG
jgi:hypothetical protein